MIVVMADDSSSPEPQAQVELVGTFELPAPLQELIATSPDELDLTDADQLVAATTAADLILQECSSDEALLDVERYLLNVREEVPLLVHLAVKLAKSKRYVDSLTEPVHISVVFSMYKEHERIQRSSEHPYGEDFLRRKIAQLQWLAEDAPSLTWQLIAVDDGCPEDSGKRAEEILLEDPELVGAGTAEVLYLADAIDAGLPVAGSLRTTDDSQKGGGVEYGMWHAVQDSHPGHVVAFTDADLSTHLGQLGLLINPIIVHDRLAAIGSRREWESVVVKQGSRNTRGKLFIYLWKRLIWPLNYIVDTQCGFKAFRADVVREIVETLMEKRFAFDIEFLLRVELIESGAIEKVPIAWIDSEAASTTTSLQPYLTMLKSTVQFYRKYLPPDPVADEFAGFLEDLDEASWERLTEVIPAEIAEADPASFDEYADIRAADLVAALRAAN